VIKAGSQCRQKPTPGPTVGPALGQHGVNIMGLQEYNVPHQGEGAM